MTFPVSKMPIYNRAVEEMSIKIGSMPAKVLAFMVAFDQLPRKLNEQIPPQDFTLSARLVEEEIAEMASGFNKLKHFQSFENLTEFVDGAIDTIYVILWSLLKFNVPVQACFDEVQRSNMAKLQADGSYIKNAAGKVQKPANWTPPDLHSILVQHFDGATWSGNIRTGEKEN